MNELKGLIYEDWFVTSNGGVHSNGTILREGKTDFIEDDHDFICNFIPYGVAFLLKGEYDIVRNFLLHTLQLQVSFRLN